MSRVDDSPGWPSLYNPGLELYPLENRDPEQPGGVYLHHYSDIFRFTLYWTIVLCVPIYFLCATLAFCNVVAPGRKQRDYGEAWEMQLLGHSQRPRKTNERRSRLTFALLVVFIFLAMSLLGALIGSTITSLVLLGMFRSGGYSMSTWMPFLAASLQVLMGLMNSWPSRLSTPPRYKAQLMSLMSSITWDSASVKCLFDPMDETSPLMGSHQPQEKGLSSTLRALRSISSKLSLQSLTKPKAKRTNLNKKSLFVLRPEGPGLRRISRNASPLNSPRRSPRRSPLRHPRRGASAGSLSLRFNSVQSTTPIRVQFDPEDEYLTSDGDDNDDHISISSAPLPSLEPDGEDPFRTPPRRAVRAALRVRDENVEDDDDGDIDVEMEGSQGSPNSLKRKKSQMKALQILGPEATADVVKMNG